MADNIYNNVKSRIKQADEGTIFLTNDFTDLANDTTIRKCLGRLTDAGMIRRILNGVYEKPKYSKLLKKNMPTDPDAVAAALARRYHWVIAPCGDVALNRLGLSTQVPAVWSYISDGPYREFKWDNIRLSFRHRANREISDMSELTVMVTEAFKTLGKGRITEDVIDRIRKKLTKEDKEVLLREARDSSSWIYEAIRKVCE